MTNKNEVLDVSLCLYVYVSLCLYKRLCFSKHHRIILFQWNVYWMGPSLPVSPSSINFTGAFSCLKQGVHLWHVVRWPASKLFLWGISWSSRARGTQEETQERGFHHPQPPPPPPHLARVFSLFPCPAFLLPRFNFATRFTFYYLTKNKFWVVSSSMNDMRSVWTHVDNSVHCNLTSILLLDIKVT